MALADASRARHLAEAVSGQRVLRAREIVEEMEFCRGDTELDTLRSRCLTITCWADSYAAGRIQVLLNAKIIVISRRGGDYEITQEGRGLLHRPIFRRKSRRVALRANGGFFRMTSFQYLETPPSSSIDSNMRGSTLPFRISCAVSRCRRILRQKFRRRGDY